MYDYEPECLNCSHRANAWVGRATKGCPATDHCDLDPRLEILVYPDHVETPPGCPLVLAEVERMVEARINAGQTRKGE
jgi:hypothetical protein